MMHLCKPKAFDLNKFNIQFNKKNLLLSVVYLDITSLNCITNLRYIDIYSNIKYIPYYYSS